MTVTKWKKITYNQYRYRVGITLVSRWAEFGTSMQISVPVINVPGNMKEALPHFTDGGF